MLVYRVQNADNIGPYHAGYGYTWMTRDHATTERHPSPYEDGMDDFRLYSEMRCGFDSLAKLRTWFCNEELSNLGELGFRIVVWDVADDAVIRGHKQVAFNPKDAIVVSSIKLTGRACGALKVSKDETPPKSSTGSGYARIVVVEYIQ